MMMVNVAGICPSVHQGPTLMGAISACLHGKPFTQFWTPELVLNHVQSCDSEASKSFCFSGKGK